jgi:hypothetical protein
MNEWKLNVVKQKGRAIIVLALRKAIKSCLGGIDNHSNSI